MKLLKLQVAKMFVLVSLNFHLKECMNQRDKCYFILRQEPGCLLFWVNKVYFVC